MMKGQMRTDRTEHGIGQAEALIGDEVIKEA